MMKALVLLSILGGALALSGCGSSDSSEAQSASNTVPVEGGKGATKPATGMAPPPAPEATN
ncbi:hypothetical protein EON81_24965 [bacterium]|nr:MAG: hypothetical protein EON81_24965 [bacterium]